MPKVCNEDCQNKENYFDYASCSLYSNMTITIIIIIIIIIVVRKMPKKA